MLLACNLRVGTHFKLVKKKRQVFGVKTNCRKIRLQATTLLQGHHASSFTLPNATHHAFIIYCRQRKHAQVDNLIRGHHHLNLASGLVVTRKIRARKWRH